MKYLVLVALVSVGLLAACRKNVKEEPTDYEGIKSRAQESQNKLDSNKD